MSNSIAKCKVDFKTVSLTWGKDSSEIDFRVEVLNMGAINTFGSRRVTGNLRNYG